LDQHPGSRSIQRQHLPAVTLPFDFPFQRLSVRAAFWDLSLVHLADPKTGANLCRLFLLNKRKNAQGQRAAKGSALDRPTAAVSPAPSSMAPLLQKLIQQYAITGLPPAFLPKQQSNPAHE
jgi:putative transposase